MSIYSYTYICLYLYLYKGETCKKVNSRVFQEVITAVWLAQWAVRQISA